MPTRPRQESLVGRSDIRQPQALLSASQHHETKDWMMIRRAYRILTDPEERIAYDSAAS